MKQAGANLAGSKEPVIRKRSLETAAPSLETDAAATFKMEEKPVSRSVKVETAGMRMNESRYSFTDNTGEDRQVVIGFIDEAGLSPTEKKMAAEPEVRLIGRDIGVQGGRLITGDLTDSQKLALQKLAAGKIGSPYLERYVAAQYMDESTGDALKIDSVQDRYSPEQPVKLRLETASFGKPAETYGKEPMIIQINRNGDVVWVQPFNEPSKFVVSEEKAAETEEVKIQQWLKKDLREVTVAPGTYQARIIVLTDPPQISQPTSFIIK
jgi:hypothetical protein